MRLPKKVKILGLTFNIDYCDFDKAVQGNNMLGNCNNMRQRIQIDKAAHRECQESTVLHEIIHLVSDNLHLELSEKTTTALASGLYQVLNDNGFLKEK